MNTDDATSNDQPATLTEPAAPAMRMKVRPRPANKPQTKHPPQYAVVLHNDPINRFEWVIGVLTRVLRCGGMRAFWLTLKTHTRGRSVVWAGALEVAEFKAEQIRDAGPDPTKTDAKPLSVSIEPLPS